MSSFGAPRVRWHDVTGEMPDTDMLPATDTPIVVEKVATSPSDDGNGDVTISYRRADN